MQVNKIKKQVSSIIKKAIEKLFFIPNRINNWISKYYDVSSSGYDFITNMDIVIKNFL